jgi:hypothetical protein
MKELMRNNDKVYVVLRRVPLHNIITKNGAILADAFNAWKEVTGADHVLKNSTHFIFCETVVDVEWEAVPIEEDASASEDVNN